MARIAVLVDDMFEDSEYSAPVDAFKEAGHEVVNLGMKEGSEVRGKKENTSVLIDRKVDDAG